MDEEFPEYQKLLDDMATDPTLVTLPGFSSLAAPPLRLRPETLPGSSNGGMGGNRGHMSLW